MNYKLNYYDNKEVFRNGIYLNIEDLIAAMFNEKVEYKNYCSMAAAPLSFEDFQKENQRQLEELIKNTKDNYIDLKYCRISLIDS